MTEVGDLPAIGIGVVGCGDWGRNHIRTLAGMGRLAWLYDPDPARLAAAAQLAPGVRQGRALDELLDNGVAGVVIASPAVTHRDLAEQIMGYGCDVLVEKPLALSVAEARTIARLAVDLGRVLMVGHVLEYHPGLLRAFTLVAEGAIGEPRYAYSNRLNFGKVRTEESILWSFAPHDIALMLRLGGRLPVTVSAESAALLRAGMPDVTVTHLDFPGRLRAHIFVSWLHPFKEQRFVVVGSEGTITFDGVGGDLVLHRQSVAFEAGVATLAAAPAEKVPFATGSALGNELTDFIECIVTRRRPVADAASGIEVLRVIEACATNSGPTILTAD